MKQDIAHSPFYVVKRDGGEVPFDAAKIGGALSRCYAAIGRPTPEGASASVVSVLAGKYGASVTVEQVQENTGFPLLPDHDRQLGQELVDPIRPPGATSEHERDKCSQDHLTGRLLLSVRFE